MCQWSYRLCTIKVSVIKLSSLQKVEKSDYSFTSFLMFHGLLDDGFLLLKYSENYKLWDGVVVIRSLLGDCKMIG